MKASLTRLEAGLALVLAVLALLALLGPHVPQYAHYHAFADQRSIWGIPHAMDVLSNVPFAVAGIWGLIALRGLPMARPVAMQRILALTFFWGLLVTAVGSSYYHLQPDDANLAWDRLGMVTAFAGLIGLAAADRVSARAGAALTALVLVAGPLGIVLWQSTGNLLLWSLVQGGGMLLVLMFAACKPVPRAWGVSLVAVIGIYALAKCLEFADAAVFALTQGWVSGHSLKHVAAALAAWPVIQAVHNAHAIAAKESQ